VAVIGAIVYERTAGLSTGWDLLMSNNLIMKEINEGGLCENSDEADKE
jgi:hypothetical protein